MRGMATLDNKTDNLFERKSEQIRLSQRFVISAINVTEVRARFEVGRDIFEDEWQRERDTYGQQLAGRIDLAQVCQYLRSTIPNIYLAKRCCKASYVIGWLKAMKRRTTNGPFTRMRAEKTGLLIHITEKHLYLLTINMICKISRHENRSSLFSL